MGEIEETAKATQEIAKTTNTALETTRDFGSYMSQFFTPSLEKVSELITDKLKYYTWQNKVNLMCKAQEKIEQLELTPKNSIPLNLGIPLLEAASLEDDSKLQDLWANLLVNSSTIFSLERSYISVLEQLSSLEAQILIKIYSNIIYDGNNPLRIDVSQYPEIEIIKNESIIVTEEEAQEDWDNAGNDKKSSTKDEEETIEYGITDLNLAFSNLIRLNCLLRVITFGGGENFKSVHPTIFGAKLYEALKEPIK